MYFVYAIKSQKDGRIYVGLSSNIQKRVTEHNAGYVFSTKGFRPWKLIYKEDVINRKEARIREKYFKNGFGKELLKSIPL
ncbi:endonuclease [Candidatus Roizmanbacteria bacterium CG03_land_8_20_14_0_80_35_26]|uniref:Endonuclease n=1 Tax=Candidatus Roizmanbacteria bacterium CG03_land_8_20_14_0_80_35_26 TaxID=1974845 RepID=A0A2M7BWL4_9BACT|nr:MAG: endonuclease [Candidatus Roizmanbacteria bacterium CG03_land_8_20_14_0_80_35_26]PJC80663.1 MAG: endonuclease [Candidatus Roizmanbacteria bacterium CG_4_8_14_3_um_filter_36_12]